jgi:hypothetical protein
VARSGGFFKDFEHPYTSVNGVGNRDARASTASDWAAEIFVESVTFCAE